MYKTIKTLLFTACLLGCSPAFSLSLTLDGSITTESGTDCDIATYRLGVSETWNGTALDLLVEVVDLDNEVATAGYCVGIRDGVLSVNLRDKDAGDDIAFVDTIITVVARNTTTPVNVDRITATGFDLDNNNNGGQYATGTDDIYFTSIGAGFVSGNTLVTYNSGAFVGGHDIQLEGSPNGNCDDAPNNLAVECRASATWTGGSSNSVSQVAVRFQNDNAYGLINPTDDRFYRLLQVSFEDDHAEELLGAVSDHGDTPSSYGDADHPSVSMFTILGYGLSPDQDFAQQPNLAATGDDNDPAPGTPNYDDEDGIFRNGASLQDQTVTAGVNEAIDVLTFGGGYLSGWVDLNHDGDFTDAGENVLSDVVISSNTVKTTTVTMDIPLTATGGTAYARFRFDTQPGLSYQGSGTRGEVEDYRIFIDPMAPAYNMVKTSDTATTNSTGVITYTFTLENTGNVPLSNVTVNDPDIDSGSMTGCPIATLAVGATATCTATRTISQAQIDSGAPLTNTATVTAEDPVGNSIAESNTADNTTQTTITAVFSHDIVKAAPVNADEDGSGDISEGDTLTYTITATNTGTASLTNLVVEDLMLSPSSQTCGSVVPTATCVLVGTYSVTAADVAATTINNTATAQSNQTASLSDSQSVDLPTPGLAIVKPAPSNADEDGTGDISVGDTLSYTITATNTDTATLTNVVVSDAMLTPTSATCATVAQGATCVLSGTYVVTATDVANGSIDNTATANSDQTPPVDATQSVAPPVPNLVLDKAAPTNADADGSSDISVGDVLEYTITASNNGTATLTNVVVSDSMLNPSSSTCATLAPNATCVLIGEYTVTAADQLAGSIVNTASADSDQTGQVQDVETVLVPVPELSLVKPAPVNGDQDGSGDVSVGDVLTYTITATNSGGAVLTNVVVSDPLLTPNSNSCASLAPNATCVLTGTYTVTAANVAAGNIDNTAIANSDQTPQTDAVQSVALNQPSHVLDKAAPSNADEDGSTDISVGDTLTYTVTATNNSQATLTNLVVTDPMLTPGSATCAIVAPLGTCVLTGDYVVTTADVTATSIVNTASSQSDQTPVVDDTETVVVPNPLLALDKAAPTNADQDGSTDISVGDTLSYTITATNNGTAYLTNVVVSDPLITPNSATCALLAPSATCVLSGDYNVVAADVAAGQIDNTATADSDQTPLIDDDQQVNINSPSHEIDKAAPTNADEDSSTDISAGDTLTYTITATNNGAATLTNLVVSDPMLTPNSSTCASVAPLGTCVLTGDYTVSAADVAAGTIVNIASSQSDQTPAIDDTETVTVPAPALVLDKAVPVNADEDGSTDVSVGDTLTYTITATNSGTAQLTNVVVSDPLITPSTNTCALLAPNATCVLSGDYTVTATDVTAGQIDNTATADSDQTSLIDDDQQVNINIPSHILDKAAPVNADEDGSTDISVGDTLTYTITATNNSLATLTNLVVNDPMLTPSTNTCTTVVPNATCVLTGSYSVTTSDVVAGSIVNTAGSVSDQTGNVDDTETVTVPTPMLALDKAAPVNNDLDGSGDVSVGDELTYTITATNTGAAVLTNLVVSDPLITPNTTTCAVVPTNATCVLTGIYVVTAADVAAGAINNTATADSDQTGAVDDNQAVVLNAPSLALDKSVPANADEDGSADISAGDTLSYTITATNNGSSNLTNVVVNDPMITPNSTACAAVTPNATCVLTGTYSVTAADVVAGQIDNVATAISDQTPQIDDTQSVVLSAPSLALDKPLPTNADEDGSTDISAGDTLTYTITATNNGSSNLTNVVVNDPLISPSSTSCASLAPGADCVLVGTYTVIALDVIAGQIDNTATADSDQTAEIDDSQSVALTAPSHILDKSAPTNADEDGSTDISLGDTLTYTVTATNNGAATLTNLIVSDPMLTPNTNTCALVAVNGTCVLTGTYVVTASDVLAGEIVNTASSESDQTGVVEDTETVIVPTPSLALDKPAPVNGDQDGSADLSESDVLTYTVTATNNGSAVLTNVVVSDPLISPTSTSCASLAVNATCVLTGTYTVTAADVVAGQIDNTATANSDQVGPVDDDQTVLLNAPDLALDKAAPTNADEDGSTDVSVGDTLTYIITATNSGSSNLTNVVVSDPMLSPNSTNCAVLAPNATCVLTGTYNVTVADVTSAQITNIATASSDQTPILDDTEIVPVPMPSHTLAKSFPGNADEDGSGDISVGDTLTYTITATNNGTAILTNLVVSDSMISPNVNTCASVAVNATCVLTGTYVVTAADVAAAQIDNTATSSSDQTPAVDDTQSVVLNAPSLALDKAAPVNADEDGSTDVSIADTLTYTVTATNNGSSNLTNVVVSDPMLSPNSATCANVAPAGTCVLTGTYSVTAADVSAVQITNTAQANSDQTAPLTDTEVVLVPQPSHMLVKVVPSNADEDNSGDISVGDTLTYVITATNDGTAVLTNLVINDSMITPSSLTCASVTPGNTCILTGTYVVTSLDVSAGQIDNTATSQSDQTGPIDDDQSVMLNAPSLALDKAAPVNTDEDGTTDVSAGDTLTYTITATNNGASNLTNVVVSDPMLTPNTSTCATLAPAGNCVLTGVYTVVLADVTAGQIDNTATAVSDQTPTIDDSETVPVPNPSHVLSKALPTNADEDGSADISAGDTLTYTVTATNNGTAVLSNLVVSDPMISPNAITCSSVAPGDTCVLVGEYTVTQADVNAAQIVNTATSVSDQTPVVEDTQTVTLNAPALVLDKSAPTNSDEDGSTDVSAGDTLTYTITATNNGGANLTNVVVSDPLIVPTSATCASVAPGSTCVLIGTYTVTASDVVAGQIDNTAQAISDQTPALQDTETVPVPTPSHVLSKAIPANADEDGSNDISVGDTLTYTITATNNGTALLTNLVVSDPMIAPATITCASVAPAATCVLTGTYTATAADVAAGQIDNTATSISAQTPQVDDMQTVVLNAPSLALDKTAPANADEDGSTDVSVGDTLTYTITATNNGASNLTNVVVSDSMITPNTTNCATLAPGSTCVLVGSYTVASADVTAGQIDNTATAVSDQTGLIDDSETVPVPTPSYALVKAPPVNGDEDSSGDVSVSDTLTYTITATNDGTAILTNVVVSDPLITPDTATCASVAPGGTCVLTGIYTVTSADVTAGQIDNTAIADSDQTDPLDDSESVVVSAPLLALDKAAPANTDEDGTTDVSAGDTLTYTITATNNGVTNLTNVIVSDSMLIPNTFACATVAPAATCVLTGTYSVTAADVAAGQIVNTATAQSDQISQVEDTETVPVPQPSHVLVKAAPVSADEDGSNDVSVGDTLTYTITATNDGTAILTNLVVSDSMIVPNTITCATVAPASTCVLTGTYVATAADVTAGQIENTATSVSDQTPVVDDTQIIVLGVPQLALKKAEPVNTDEDGSGDISVGDTLTYTITATNNGSTNLTNVVVNDTTITPATSTCATVQPGATCVLVGTYSVTAADVTAGQIDNTATAVSDQTPSIQDDVTVPLQTPAITLVKELASNADEDGSGDLTVGDTLTYNAVATNTGSSVLTNVVVSDSMLIPGAETCSTLAPQATCTLTGTYQIATTDVAAGGIVNTAVVSSDQLDDIADTLSLEIDTPALAIAKKMTSVADNDLSGNVSLGDVLTYTVTATNSGETTLTDIIVSDAMLTPDTFTCALVAQGDTCVLTGNYTVAANDVIAGSILNTATANSDQTDPVSDNHTVTVVEQFPPVTQDDSRTNQPLGQPVTIDVLGDDSDPENNVDPTTVVIIDPNTGNTVTSLTVPGEGVWTVDPVTGAITFTPEPGFIDDPTPIDYQVTDTTGLVSNISKVTIDYEAAASLTGTVWMDSDRNGFIDTGEPIKPDWTLEVYDDQGNLIATTMTDANGEYHIGGLIPGAYTVKFYNEAGVFIAESETDGEIAAGATVDLPLPIDPSGIVYDSITREPIPGVTLQFVNSAGVPVDPACLGTNQQGQTTQADGFYAFDVLPDADPSCPDGETYTIVFASVPGTYVNDISVNIPPAAGVFDSAANEANCTVDTYPQSSACEVAPTVGAPQIGDDTTYYFSFTLTSGDSNVIFNHLPLDPFVAAALGNMRLLKTVNRTSASIGDVLYYTVTVENDLADIAEKVSITDDLPRGFRVVDGSATVVTLDANNKVLSQAAVATTGVDPVVFSGLTVPAVDTGSIAISYAVRVGAGVLPGGHTNTAQVTEGGTSNLANARVMLVADAVLEQATVIGKVFHDRDADGLQDTAMVRGIRVKSEYFGWSGLNLGSLSGRANQGDPITDHQVVVSMLLTDDNRFEVTTAQGTRLSIDENQRVTESHVGDVAGGLNAQDIRVSTRIIDGTPTRSPIAGQLDGAEFGRVLEITIANAGINEAGIPGVRLATVGGLLIESDQAGRFHIPDTVNSQFGDGHQFILKVDTATLPRGATLTTENPRVLRITSSALNVMNFGVSLPEVAPFTAAAIDTDRVVDVELGSVFFDTDKHNVRADQRGTVEDIVNKIRRFKRGRIVIKAHTDKRQTAQYNIALSKRRARTIERELRSILGDELMDQVSIEVDTAAYNEIDTSTNSGSDTSTQDQLSLEAK